MNPLSGFSISLYTLAVFSGLVISGALVGQGLGAGLGFGISASGPQVGSGAGLGFGVVARCPPFVLQCLPQPAYSPFYQASTILSSQYDFVNLFKI